MSNITLLNGDCLVKLQELDDNSVDSIVTDPPYGIDFMGKKWDYDVPSTEIWEQALRVLKPGGYLLAFAGTRTQHRMAVRIEDAGFLSLITLVSLLIKWLVLNVRLYQKRKQTLVEWHISAKQMRNMDLDQMHIQAIPMIKLHKT